MVDVGVEMVSMYAAIWAGAGVFGTGVRMREFSLLSKSSGESKTWSSGVRCQRPDSRRRVVLGAGVEGADLELCEGGLAMTWPFMLARALGSMDLRRRAPPRGAREVSM